MGYLIGLIILVVGEILKRYALPAILATVVLTVVVGAISAASGGQFLIAAKYTLEVCLGLGVLAVVVTTFAALSNGFR
jgi:hypothetical protein